MQIISILAPIFLASFLLGKKDQFNYEEFVEKYGILVKDYKGSLFCLYFHVIFLVRRLCIVFSVYLLKNWPAAQVSLICVSCWIVISIQVFIHNLVARPFKDRVFNIIFILIELAVSACYTALCFLLRSDVNVEILMWIILGCMYFSYLLHSILGYYKIIKIIYQALRSYRNREVTTISKQEAKLINFR